MTFLVLAVGFVMATPAQASRDRPTRVLIVVLDQMRPEYVASSTWTTSAR